MFFYQKTEFEFDNLNADFSQLFAPQPIFNPVTTLVFGDTDLVGNQFDLSGIVALNVVFHIDTTYTGTNCEFNVNSLNIKTFSDDLIQSDLDQENIIYSNNFFDPIVGGSGIKFIKFGFFGSKKFIIPTLNCTFQKTDSNPATNDIIILPFIEVVKNHDE